MSLLYSSMTLHPVYQKSQVIRLLKHFEETESILNGKKYNILDSLMEIGFRELIVNPYQSLQKITGTPNSSIKRI